LRAGEKKMSAVKTHYDAVGTATKKARASGALFELKKFHNHVKRSLLRDYASNAERLLDLACGRGGDLQKWHDCSVEFVKGVDVSPKEIQEARARYANLKTGMMCSFEVVDILQNTFRQAPCYDVVTAMFCIHYFCESKRTLEKFLELVASCLRPGGYFLGCCLDGSLVKTFPGSEHVTIEFLENDQIVFALRDTVTSSTADSRGSVEYLVDVDTLREVAAKVGLECVKLMPFDPPHEYPGHDISRLFFSFVFRLKGR
jgi:mRNA (guanine-N7-)-methyltransferase